MGMVMILREQGDMTNFEQLGYFFYMDNTSYT